MTLQDGADAVGVIGGKRGLQSFDIHAVVILMVYGTPVTRDPRTAGVTRRCLFLDRGATDRYTSSTSMDDECTAFTKATT
jgi:hypothetical protein